MESRSRNFDRFSNAFTRSYNRRDALRMLGLTVIGAGGASVLAPVSGDAFAAFPFADVNKPETAYQGTRLGLSVDGGSPDQ